MVLMSCPNEAAAAPAAVLEEEEGEGGRRGVRLPLVLVARAWGGILGRVVGWSWDWIQLLVGGVGWGGAVE